MIFPQPIKESYGEGAYLLSDYESNIDLMYLYEKYGEGNSDVAYCEIAGYGEDEYTLTVGKTGVIIACGRESGRFRAITTLRQLLHEHGERLPYCEIYDKPQYERRGYMLDISRGKIPRLDTLMKLADYLAELKYNELQLYMENFCFKFPHFPEVTDGFDCLTPEDVMALDAYCAERFIDLVPNQNCFGHMAVWLSHEKFAHLAVTDGKTRTGTLNILHPEAEAFVEKLFDSVLPYFRSKYVNIGLDEAFGLGKFQLEEICREKGKDAVFMEWLDKVASMIKRKYGKTVMFWSDMVYEAKESFHLIPEGAIALNWSYDLIETALMDRRNAYLEKAGIPFYVCPGTSTWTSFAGRFDLMTFNLRTSAEFGVNHGAKGYLLTDWGSGDNHLCYPVFSLVPIALGAQYAWNTGVEQTGYEMKHPFTRAAQRYVDAYVFGGNAVSHFHYKLAQTYLLEPERVHCSSEVPFAFGLRLDQTEVPGFFDIANQDSFYYENVIYYVKRILDALASADFSDRDKEKRQTVLDAKLYLLGAELSLVRMNRGASPEKARELIAMIDEILPEHRLLWFADNFENGLERSVGVLERHRGELLAMLS